MSDGDANSNNGSTDSNDSLNGSWVKLERSSVRNDSVQHQCPISVHNGTMEDLLAEAVVDDSKSSYNKGCLSSPTSSEQELVETKGEHMISPDTNDRSWVEDWSSRVEPNPPKKWKLTYPPKKTQYISTSKRKTNIIQVNLYIVIPSIVITHIIAFGIGFYLGRRSTAYSSPV